MKKYFKLLDVLMITSTIMHGYLTDSSLNSLSVQYFHKQQFLYY